MPSMLLKRKESKEEMVGAVYPGSRTIIEVVVSTRVIESLSRIKVEKRKPTANNGADCIDMVLLTHSTVYHNTEQLGMVHLLDISTTSLTIEHQAG